MKTSEQLLWVGAGTLAWFSVRSVFPRVAGLILTALVIGALVITLGK